MAVFLDTPPVLEEVKVRDRSFYITKELFDAIARKRGERINSGSRINTGPYIRDFYADHGIQLTRENNEVSIFEVTWHDDFWKTLDLAFGKSKYDMLEGEYRPNPNF